MKQADLLEKCASLIKALCTQLDTENLHLDNYQYSTVFVRYAEAVLNSLSNPDYDLVRLCYNIGNYFTATGDLNKAMTAYQKMEAIQAELLETQPDYPDFKNGLAISYEKLGSTHSALGNLQQALTFFEKRNQLGEELYAAYPQNVAFKNGLAISYEKLGSTHTALGNFHQVLTFFEQYNELEKQLYAAYPQNVEFKNALALSYQLLGWFHDQKLQNPKKAQSYYRNSQKLLQELIANFPGYVQFQTNLDWVNKQLEE
jgi:tetratricopeptide (TPR) repeat protein